MFNFEDREVTNPMTYTMVTNPDGTVTLTPAPGTVSAEGTPINKKTMEDLQRDIYNTLYPVGHVMLKADATDYSTWLEFVWERIAEGDAIVGYKANDSQYGQIGVEFGNNSSTVTYNGSSGATTLTLDQIPSHGHGVNDPGHNHYVNDPGHAHGVTYGSGTSASEWTPGKTIFQGDGKVTWNTAGSGTGIWLNASKTSVTIQMSGGSKSHTHTINHSHTVSVVQKSYPVAVWKRVE